MTAQPLPQPLPQLSDRDLRRYARHLTLTGFGAQAQRQLRGSRVLVVGAGGLGSPALWYLAAAGVGHITIIDDDVVDESNLQRQVIHRESDIGRPKAESARDAVLRLDSAMSVTALVERLHAGNALKLFAEHDIVLDGADNFATRYLSSDAAEITGTPLVWATILQFGAQLSVFWPGRGPMLRDLFPDIPDPDWVPTCAAAGVLGAMVGQVGAMMVVEAVKVLTGVGTAAVGKLLLIDALGGETRSLRFDADPDREPVTSLAELAQVCAPPQRTLNAPAPETTPAPLPQPGPELGPHAVAQLRERGAVVVDVREPDERAEVHIADSLFVPLGHIEQRGWAAIAEQLATADSGAASPAPQPQGASAAGLPTTVVLQCRSGARSARALALLSGAQVGFEPGSAASQSVGAPADIELINLHGGIIAWEAAGLPVVR